MTIKKTVSNTTVTEPVAASGGAAIADRFKLDMPNPAAQRSSGGGSSTMAVIAGFLALVVAGVLTYTLWQHWEFLMPA